MKSKSAMLLVLAASPFVLAPSPSADEVSFHPKAGSTLGKQFEVAIEITMDDVSFTVQGNDMSEQMGSVDLEADGSMSISDQYVAVADGRPTELIRSFDDVEFAWSASDESGHADEMEKLESRKVRFKWNADEKRYDVSFHESEGDSDLLEGLAEDMDLRALLPEDEVSSGDSWEVPISGLGAALFAGSNFEKGELSGEEQVDELLRSEILPQLEKAGESIKTTCTYKGSREVDGVRAGVIEIKFEGKPSLDLSSAIQRMIELQTEGQEIEIDVGVEKADVTSEITGKGELLWNLGAGHLHAFSMQSNFDLDVDIQVEIDAQGESVPIAFEAAFKGTGDWKVETKE